MVALGISEFDNSHISDAIIIKDSILHRQDRDDKQSSMTFTLKVSSRLCLHATRTVHWPYGTYQLWGMYQFNQEREAQSSTGDGAIRLQCDGFQVFNIRRYS